MEKLLREKISLLYFFIDYYISCFFLFNAFLFTLDKTKRNKFAELMSNLKRTKNVTDHVLHTREHVIKLVAIMKRNIIPL